MNVKLSKILAMLLLTIPAAFAQADPCRDETQKAINFYDMCLKFNPQSLSYMDCVNIYMEQRAKTLKVCKVVDSPSPTSAPAVVLDPEPAPSMASSTLPPGCMNEFSGIATSNFDLLGFVKKLPVEVVKVKAQAKIPKTPFNKGPDPDDKKTDIGITVGCLKAFPESKNEIMSALKEVGMEMSIGIVASKAGIARSQVPNDINQLRDLALQNGIQPVADALSLLAGSGTAAEGGDDEPENESGDKKGVRFGVRAGFNINNFSWGYKDWDKDQKFGQSYGMGLQLNVPFASIVGLNAGLEFYYRKLFSYEKSSAGEKYERYMSEYAVSIPVLFQLGNSFYAAAGAQFDIPISPEIVSKSTYNGETKKEKEGYLTDHRTLDFGLALGLGYRFSNLGVDFRFVYSLDGLFEDFRDYKVEVVYKDKSSLMQYGVGLSYFF
jgi:hypothetical protein